MMEAPAARAELTLELTLDGQVDEVQSDQRRVRQMLLNLLGNAVKFTPEGGRVGIVLTADAQEVQIAIWDTGVGIAAQDLDRIFEAFSQFDSEQARRHQGTGLGLNLTSRLATLLGGRIDVQSAQGEGSRFTIRLPR